MEIPKYDKYDYEAFLESNCMKYMSNLKQNYDNVEYTIGYDSTPLLIDNTSLVKEKVKKIQASKYREDLKLNEVLHIIEYTTNKKAKDMFDFLMRNYAPNSAYFAYKDNMLFISNIENNKGAYKNIIDVELKTADTYQNTNNILVENVLSFGLDEKYMENNFSGMIISSYAEYNNLVTMAKAHITKNVIYDTNTMFNVITEDDFTNFKFILIQMQIMPYSDGWKYDYKFNSSQLIDGILDIAYDEQEITAEYAVAKNACVYALYKINKEIKIDKINITSYTSIDILGRYFYFNDERYEMLFPTK